MIRLAYGLFALSGAAALIYESTWSRYLALFVGHGAYAQVLVLAIFLGGMAIGSALVGRRSARLREPLLWFAGVELVLGALGLVFHHAFDAATGASYEHVFRALGGGVAVTVAKWGIAGGLILPQSVLLGATFPLISAGVLRRASNVPGRVLASLYFTNALGGAAGVLIAGFYLVAAVGLPGAVRSAAAINLLVAIATLAALQAAGGRHEGGTSGRKHGASDSTPAPPAWRTPPPAALLLAVAFGTAVASFMYEIAWVRMLSLVLGSATHSFELMLSAFILGLALGALWVRSRIDGFRDPVRVLGLVQWVMGLAALATLPLYLASFRWTAALLGALEPTPAGYGLFAVARYAVCLAIMLPATFCAGITLPLITKVLLDGGRGERAIGTVYAVNTVGSIVGVELAGLLLLPVLGLKGLLFGGALLDVALGALVLALAAGGARTWRLPGRPALAGGACTLLLMAAIASGARLDREVLTSGVFRYRRLPAHGLRSVVFYSDGRTASVAVRETAPGQYTLSTNGKPDASLGEEWLAPRDEDAPRVPLTGDASTQALAPIITLAHAPRARSAAIIGQGSGISSHVLLGSAALERVVTIEIEPEMIRGSQLFYPANRRVFDDPRARFAIDDAKSFFATEGGTFDIILSEPSNPWVSGVASLFTAEFYARVTRHLSAEGVLGQWLQVYEMDDDLLLRIIAALHGHFASYDLYLTSPVDILIVASKGATLPVPDWGVLTQPGIAEDLRPFYRMGPENLRALRLAGHRTLAPLVAAGVPPNSDYHPAVDLRAERARYLQSFAVGFLDLATARFDPFAALLGEPVGFATDSLVATRDIARADAYGSAAQLRATLRGGQPAASASPGSAAARRLAELRRQLASGSAPADWRRWTRSVLTVERDVHAGTAGVADDQLYGALTRYLAAVPAPAPAVDAIAFVHALAAWQWPAAAAAGDRLAARAMRGDQWVAADLLRDGVVVAHLRLGDSDRARQLFRELTPLVESGGTDLRSRLLEAHLAASGTGSPLAQRDVTK